MNRKCLYPPRAFGRLRGLGEYGKAASSRIDPPDPDPCSLVTKAPFRLLKIPTIIPVPGSPREGSSNVCYPEKIVGIVRRHLSKIPVEGDLITVPFNAAMRPLGVIPTPSSDSVIRSAVLTGASDVALLRFRPIRKIEIEDITELTGICSDLSSLGIHIRDYIIGTKNSGYHSAVEQVGNIITQLAQRGMRVRQVGFYPMDTICGALLDMKKAGWLP